MTWGKLTDKSPMCHSENETFGQKRDEIIVVEIKPKLPS